MIAGLASAESWNLQGRPAGREKDGRCSCGLKADCRQNPVFPGDLSLSLKA